VAPVITSGSSSRCSLTRYKRTLQPKSKSRVPTPKNRFCGVFRNFIIIKGAQGRKRRIIVDAQLAQKGGSFWRSQIGHILSVDNYLEVGGKCLVCSNPRFSLGAIMYRASVTKPLDHPALYQIFQMITIASFPLISSLEFESACRKISERYQAGGHLQSDWEHVRLAQGYKESTAYLSITRTIQGARGKPESPVEDDGELEAFEEIDEVQHEAIAEQLRIGRLISFALQEALQLRVPANRGLMVEYDIVLSPTYQVPVLYFRIRDAGCALPLSIDTLYRYVIPEQFKSQVESLGIIGGITMTVCYFGLRPGEADIEVGASSNQSASFLRPSMQHGCCTGSELS